MSSLLGGGGVENSLCSSQKKTMFMRSVETFGKVEAKISCSVLLFFLFVL